ncbi:ATP-binding cassette domain-containing protein [Flavobacterium sp. KACC 22761]|uniref:ATP-binding cassette domain-containing protein n=1 Tax=Flavobacterium sp. KACC 22761 TaxID=3092665 RepID=UPI002A76452D|nr:ATP-binding cassette domain-containing protein [Flavobacterium sp. KACC 22761]WPO79816.1 ATP-binding cassette domain-containing protein [Flavobacterium sp. KACC 22761]
MKKHILEISGIQKRFGDKSILSDVYLKCETSEVIGILGRNGSGKSTLLKIIAGLEHAPDRCVRINSDSLNAKNVLMNKVSYLGQNQFVPNHFSVQKVISLSIDKENRTSFCKDEFIKSLLGKKIKHLSMGELRYLEIKLVLCNPSLFVLLDEPYNGLSPLMVEKVTEMIKANLNKKGVIVTDHNYQNVLKIANKLVLIKDGKTHQIKEKSELVEKGYLVNAVFI